MLKRVILILVLCACIVPPAQAQDDQSLTVFAAASLTDAFEEIGTAFEAEHPGVDVVFNFGGSSGLAAQLAEGAPADIFASANQTQMQSAQDAGRIGGEPRVFARNRLVIIVPADNPAEIESLDDLANDGVLLVLAAPDVPVRVYTDTLLETLAADPEYDEDYRDGVLNNIVSEESNVRQVVAKVALGEADAGIVYLSDVTPDVMDELTAITIPDEYNTIAAYPIAITNDANEYAQPFVDFVLSDTGQAILERWNFIPGDGLLHIGGWVATPVMLSVEDLYANHEIVDGMGVSLWDLIQAAGPLTNPDNPIYDLSLYIVITSSSGDQIVIGWIDIAPNFGNMPILVAGDAHGFRVAFINQALTADNVIDISIYDLP